MGRRQYYRYCRELWFGEIDTLASYRTDAELALGCHLVHGMLLRLVRPDVGISAESWLMHRQDSFYKTLTPEQSSKAFANEFDFDAPDVRDWSGDDARARTLTMTSKAIDFDVLVQRLRDLKAGYAYFQSRQCSSKGCNAHSVIESGQRYRCIRSPNTSAWTRPHPSTHPTY
jgi:hypothetical protein